MNAEKQDAEKRAGHRSRGCTQTKTAADHNACLLICVHRSSSVANSPSRAARREAASVNLAAPSVPKKSSFVPLSVSASQRSSSLLPPDETSRPTPPLISSTTPPDCNAYTAYGSPHSASPHSLPRSQEYQARTAPPEYNSSSPPAAASDRAPKHRQTSHN